MYPLLVGHAGDEGLVVKGLAHEHAVPEKTVDSDVQRVHHDVQLSAFPELAV